MDSPEKEKKPSRTKTVLFIGLFSFSVLALILTGILLGIHDGKEFGDLTYGYYGCLYLLIPAVLCFLIPVFSEKALTEKLYRLFSLLGGLLLAASVTFLNFRAESFPVLSGWTETGAVFLSLFSVLAEAFLLIPFFRNQGYEKAGPILTYSLLAFSYLAMVFVYQLSESSEGASILTLLLGLLMNLWLFYLFPDIRKKIRGKIYRNPNE
jgi:hypothetical protein